MVSAEDRGRVDARHVRLALQEHRLQKLVVLSVMLPLVLAWNRLGRVEQRVKRIRHVVADVPEAALEVLLQKVVRMANALDHELIRRQELSPFPLCPT